MRNLLKAVSILLVISTLILLVGCAGGKEYVYCEIGVKIPRGFKSVDASDGYDLAFEDSGLFLGIRRFSFEAVLEDGILSTHTPLKFAEIYRSRLTGVSPSPIYERDYIPYFSYLDSSSGTRLAYMSAFFRTPYAYYIITIIAKNSINEGERVKFFEVCDSFYILPEYV